MPAPLSSTIIEIREQVGVARQVCNIQPTSGDTLSIPKRDGGLTVYAPGEGNAITDSDKSWSEVALYIKKRAVASYISQELSEDALINIVDNVVTRGVDAVVLAPINFEGLDRTIESVYAKMPVVIFDSGCRTQQYTAFVATDNYKGGQLAGEEMLRLLGEEGGEIGIVRDEFAVANQLAAE